MQICDAQVEGGCVVLALEDSRVEAIYSFGWHRAGFSDRVSCRVERVREKGRGVGEGERRRGAREHSAKIK